jgi:hypothetical protein
MRHGRKCIKLKVKVNSRRQLVKSLVGRDPTVVQIIEGKRPTK